MLAALFAVSLAAAPQESLYQLSPAFDGITTGVSALAVVLPNAFLSDLVHPSCPCDPGSVNALDRHVIGNHSDAAATASNVTELAVLALPPLLDLVDVGANRAWAEDTVVFAEALAVNGALVTLVKVAVQRPIPRAYEGLSAKLLRDPDSYESFYSGHTSTAFAALMAAAFTISHRHGNTAWPYLAAAAIGSSVAVERVAAGRHFYTDVAVAAVLGTAVGLVVPALHQRNGSLAVTSTRGPGMSIGPSLAFAW